MKTFNEGKRFPTGHPVWVVIRSRKPFGDTKLLLYMRAHGNQAWVVAGEQIVDPKWDTVAMEDNFDTPGTFDVKIIDSKGKTVAEATLELF